jgi:hypothetical protein
MKKIVRTAFILLGGAASLAALYVLVICYPQPFFRYSIGYRHIHLYSTAPIPNNAGALLSQVQSRLAASPIYSGNLAQHVFICGSSAQFAFFTNFSFRSSGLTYAYFNRSICLRPSEIAQNLLVNYSGRKVLDDRNLVYYMAHELTHSLMVSYLGPLKYHELPTWLREGHADYVGKGQESFAGIQAKFEDSSYQTNREYLRYELMTAYLLDIRKIAVRALLDGNYTANILTAQNMSKLSQMTGLPDDAAESGNQKLLKRKSRALARTFSRAARSGNMRAISTAPTIVEKITKKARSLSLARCPGIKETIRSLYFRSSANICVLIRLPERASSGDSAVRGQPRPACSQYSRLK